MSDEECDPWEEASRDIPELFSPCPDCTLARECIRHFRVSPPRSEVEKKTYFKNWISRCVNHCGVKSRQELLFLADHWANYHLRTIRDRRRHSYKTTIGYCLREIINEEIYGVQLYQCNRQNFYYSGDLTEEIRRYAHDTVEFTRNLKMQNDPIGDCLIDIVAEYFIAPGDEIQIGSGALPPIWQHVYGYSGGIHTITSVISPTEVEVTPFFPGFARNIVWDYVRSSSVIHSEEDGLANRDFGAMIATLFRTRQHADRWDTFKNADDKFNALRGEAQSLVDAYNEDNYSGDIEETYTS